MYYDDEEMLFGWPADFFLTNRPLPFELSFEEVVANGIKEETLFAAEHELPLFEPVQIEAIPPFIMPCSARAHDAAGRV